MFNKFYIKLTILLLITSSFLSSFAQKEGYQRGIQVSSLASFDQYFVLQKTDNDVNYQYRSEDRFPNDYNIAYQLGLINRKKYWHQTTLNFTYFPKFTRTYTEYKTDGNDWEILPHLVGFNQEIYMLDLGKNFKINLFDHKLYASLGFGAGGGIIRWPDALDNGDIFFFAGQVWPSAGIELKLLNWLGIFGEMRYHYGMSETISQTSLGQTNQWQYRLEGQEIKIGINFYYSD